MQDGKRNNKRAESSGMGFLFFLRGRRYEMCVRNASVRLKILWQEILRKNRNEAFFMCTAISYKTQDHYFGRNLDLEYSYEESITITPRNYPFPFRKEATLEHHYALIGVAYVHSEYPLYYDAVNEKGLGMASLNFPGNAVYQCEKENMHNITPFELIPWILGQCQSVQEAKELLQKTNLLKVSFHKDLPLTPLHFMVSDKFESIVVEPMHDGLRIYDNPVKVLTNNPPFPYHLFHLNNYMNLTKKEPVNRFAKEIPLEIYSRGMGSIGLPGDMSSPSRFVRAAFIKWNSIDGRNEEENVSQFFHILDSVKQYKGCVQVESGEYEFTVYSVCCNTDKGIYYYKTYYNNQIIAVDMHREDLDGEKVVMYPLVMKGEVRWGN